MEQRKIAILGGDGFVGTNMFLHISNNHPEFSVYKLSKTEFDIANPETWGSLQDDTETVIHCAAISAGDEYEVYRVNALESTNLARFLTQRGVKKLVYYSTGGVYLRDSSIKSPNSAIQPEGAYATSKWLCERSFKNYFKGKLHIARLYFPYGPGQSLPRLMPRLFQNIKDGNKINCNENGGPSLTLTHIDDICKITVNDLVIGDQAPEIVNIASPHSISLENICMRIGKIMEKEPDIQKNGNQPDTTSERWPDREFRDFDDKTIQEIMDKDAFLS